MMRNSFHPLAFLLAMARGEVMKQHGAFLCETVIGNENYVLMVKSSKVKGEGLAIPMETGNGNPFSLPKTYFDYMSVENSDRPIVSIQTDKTNVLILSSVVFKNEIDPVKNMMALYEKNKINGYWVSLTYLKEAFKDLDALPNNPIPTKGNCLNLNGSKVVEDDELTISPMMAHIFGQDIQNSFHSNHQNKFLSPWKIFMFTYLNEHDGEWYVLMNRFCSFLRLGLFQESIIENAIVLANEIKTLMGVSIDDLKGPDCIEKKMNIRIKYPNGSLRYEMEVIQLKSNNRKAIDKRLDKFNMGLLEEGVGHMRTAWIRLSDLQNLVFSTKNAGHVRSLEGPNYISPMTTVMNPLDLSLFASESFCSALMGKCPNSKKFVEIEMKNYKKIYPYVNEYSTYIKRYQDGKLMIMERLGANDTLSNKLKKKEMGQIVKMHLPIERNDLNDNQVKPVKKFLIKNFIETNRNVEPTSFNANYIFVNSDTPALEGCIWVDITKSKFIRSAFGEYYFPLFINHLNDNFETDLKVDDFEVFDNDNIVAEFATVEFIHFAM